MGKGHGGGRERDGEGSMEEIRVGKWKVGEEEGTWKRKEERKEHGGRRRKEREGRGGVNHLSPPANL